MIGGWGGELGIALLGGGIVLRLLLAFVGVGVDAPSGVYESADGSDFGFPRLHCHWHRSLHHPHEKTRGLDR